MSDSAPIPPLSFLNLVEAVDNFRARGPKATQHTEELVPWHLTPAASSPVLGLLRAPVVAQLVAENAAATAAAGAQVWDVALDGPAPRVSFAAHVATPARRSRAMAAMLARWRDAGLWAGVIGPAKWRGELYPVYRNPFGRLDAPRRAGDDDVHGGDDPDDGLDDDGGLNYAFCMERAAAALFGIVTYGVHMHVFAEDPECGFKIWVPKRARTKQTWPGFYDNSVAGGIPAGYGVFESLVKESMEEASIEEEIVRTHARATGSISYFFATSEGWLQPEIEFLYDLRIPKGVDPTPFQPKPLDGEVESFELLPLPEVITRMRAGLFKTNCAAALVDFLIRFGHITPDNEPNFQEIVTRLHGRFDYERW